MNASRKARRRERRKSKRCAKKQARLAPYAVYNDVFSFWKIVASSCRCEKDVRWKRQAQYISLHRLSEITRLHKTLHDHTYRKAPAYHFILHERGKERHISGVRYRDRIVQRILCDNSMIPIFFNNIIYANGASQKSKGTDFSRNLFLNHFRESIKQYGKNGYLVQYDFRHYFDSIDSKKVCEMMLEKYKEYCPTKEDYESFSFLLNQIMLEEKGLGLGNQTSQIGAVWFANAIDHYILEQLHCGKSGRYMDDGYVFCENKVKAWEIIEEIKRISVILGLEVHPKKTKIMNITKEVVFLKRCYKWNQKTGRIDIRLCQEILKRNKKHVKTIMAKVKEGRINSKSLEDSIQCYKGVLSQASPDQVKWYNCNIKEPVFKFLEELEGA